MPGCGCVSLPDGKVVDQPLDGIGIPTFEAENSVNAEVHLPEMWNSPAQSPD